MGVDSGGFRVGPPAQVLNVADVHSRAHKVSGKAMPEHVQPHPPVEYVTPQVADAKVKLLAGDAGSQPADKERFTVRLRVELRPALAQVFADGPGRILAEGCYAVLPAFALPHLYQPAIKVNIGNLQMAHFAGPEPAGIEGEHDSAF